MPPPNPNGNFKFNPNDFPDELGQLPKNTDSFKIDEADLVGGLGLEQKLSEDKTFPYHEIKDKTGGTIIANDEKNSIDNF